MSEKIKVLICDDNPAIAKGISGYLEAEDLDVLTAENGEDALECIKRANVGLVILDIMLPGISGLDVCREIRKNLDIPIIMLSAKGEEVDRIVGLELGADDYVTKPFSPHEVAIRARKLLRRHKNDSAESERVVNVGNVKIMPESFEVSVDGSYVQLTSKEFKLLIYLAENAGKVRTRDQIINSVWGIEFEGETRMVDTLVKRLRKKIITVPDRSGISITTIFGVGYKLEEL